MTQELIKRLYDLARGPSTYWEAAAALEQQAAEIERLKELLAGQFTDGSIRYANGFIGIEGFVAPMLIEMFAAQFKESHAENYLEMSFKSSKVLPSEKFIVRVQKVAGKTPHALRLEAEEQRDAALAEIERLNRENQNLSNQLGDCDRARLGLQVKYPQALAERDALQSKIDTITKEAETNQKWAFLEWRDKAERLQAEVDQYKTQWADWSSSLDSVMKQRNDLQAKIAAMEAVEPVAVVDSALSGGIGWTAAGEDLEDGQELFAAPKVAQPLTEEAIRAEFGKLYPNDIGILELAENNRDFAVEAIGARHHWRAFLSGARAIEKAHGIGGQQ